MQTYLIPTYKFMALSKKFESGQRCRESIFLWEHCLIGLGREGGRRIYDVIFLQLCWAQWFCLIPLTRFGPILRKKSFGGRNFFWLELQQKQKLFWNTNYLILTIGRVQDDQLNLNFTKKKYFSKPNKKKPKKIMFKIFFQSSTPFIL